MNHQNTSDDVTSGRDPVAAENPLLPGIGRIVGAMPSGAIAVAVGNGEPKAAKLIAGLRRSELKQPAMQGREVLVAFEGGNPDKPIILGLLADPLDELITFDGANEPKDVVVDGNRVTLEAHDEIVLKCGEGSITLRKDGKIIIKGTHLLSRSSGPNRIKGGSVQIN